MLVGGMSAKSTVNAPETPVSVDLDGGEFCTERLFKKGVRRDVASMRKPRTASSWQAEIPAVMPEHKAARG